MLNIFKFFPTNIGYVINTDHKEIEEEIVKKCYEIRNITKSGSDSWISDKTYSTMGTYDLTNDSNFSPINHFVNTNVIKYCEQMNIDLSKIDIKPQSSWFNIYKKGDFQEFHQHTHNIISAIYILKSDEKSGKIYFKNPYNDMLSPSYTNFTPDNFERVNFKPQPGMLLIFRSHLEHYVEQNNSDGDRISFAYNYRPII